MKPTDEGTGNSMDCRKVEETQIIERYLTGRLSVAESDAFEQHYLECPNCFEKLKLRHAGAIELGRLRIAPSSARSWWPGVAWQWTAASLAVVVIAVAFLYMRSGPPSALPVQQTAAVGRPDPTVLEQLGALDQVPPYIPGLIRGGESNPAVLKFQEGMALYLSQKYADAIGPLSESARLDPDRPITRFYLGISSFVSGETDAAMQQLSSVAAQDNPYSEDAHWYLAKVFLKKRDAQSARSQLQKLESLNGLHSAAARDLLKQIEAF